jgi:hypothetical protein
LGHFYIYSVYSSYIRCLGSTTMVINSFLIKVFGKWLQGFNHARWAIMAAHLLQMWPLGDIAYY